MLGTMDAPRAQRHLRLLLVAVLLASVVLFARAEPAKKLDNDLVFDNLEQTNIKSDDNHHRIAGASEEIDPQHQYWLLHTVGRLKRSIGNLFGGNQEPSHPVEQKQQHVEKVQDTGKPRKSRQSDDGQQLLEDDEDLDDEDSLNNGDDFSGNSGDGEDKWHTEKSVPTAPPSTDPVYYRVTMSVMQPYQDEFSDPNSEEFRSFSKSLAEDIEALYDKVPGEQTATVIRIRKRETDPFEVITEVDIDSRGYYDEEALENVLSVAVNDHRIGRHVIGSGDFIFKKFVAGECHSNEFKCKNGQCVPSNSRCNRNYDCSDRSDEESCGDGSESRSVFDDVSQPRVNTGLNIIGDIEDNVLPELNPEDIGSGDGDCRADDAVRCADGSRSICSDQICDGIHDCPGGTDEENCPKNDNACNKGEIACDLARCIPQEKQCDGVQDCNDGTDERACCTADHFKCDQDKCIPNSKKCDSNNDCDDGTDEQKCICPPEYFECGPGDRCVPYEHRCNGNIDCRNGRDEEGCTDCQANEFMCGDGKCIPKTKKCDRHYDCHDHSDELNCQCLPNDFHCRNGFCIPHTQRCDGVHNCQDMSDEINCTNYERCESHEWRCADGKCIDQTLRCNFVPNCSDQSDERDCIMCDENQFRCDDGTCIDLAKKCDNHQDCPHNDDEDFCEIHCGDKEYKCERSGQSVCLPLSVLCDDNRDCDDGRDEENCEDGNDLGCEDGQIQCTDGTCATGRRCDSIIDCPDSSDEEGCAECTQFQFKCSSGQCINETLICDGRPDCPDGSDETKCAQCRDNEFSCDGTCIDQGRVCDGSQDCRDASDERNCTRQCRPEEYKCGNMCLDRRLLCDGTYDCNDGSDEANCPAKCADYEFDCGDGQCVDRSRHCDGRRDCRNNHDEEQCTERQCRSGEFRCSNGQCLPDYVKCNQQRECSDGSDERDCTIRCPPGQRACGSGDQCIRSLQFCDGKVDCNDLSDEQNCGGTGLLLKTYPSAQEIKENVYKNGGDVVFVCRDEGDIRARVKWSRDHGQPLPPNSVDRNGRLEIEKVRMEYSGTYTCSAIGYQNQPGASVDVHLTVDRWTAPTPRPVDCLPHQATCANGDCIDRRLVCDNKFDCNDGSDENQCGPLRTCEANEFVCANKKCVQKIWRCDGDNDCLDGSDELNCEPSPPGSLCRYDQFTCLSMNQCIPKGYHCDMDRDCSDGSDEIGCSKPIITQPPTPLIRLKVGQTLTINCSAVGVPIPEINWRLNWGHVPSKCTMTSVGGVGTLICRDIQIEDQGAYSCEAINAKGATFATPDANVVVEIDSVCRAGYFNAKAQSEGECIRCFCFGHATTCKSADLYIYQLQPPFLYLKVVGALIDPSYGTIEIRDEPIYRGVTPQLSAIGRNGVQTSLPQNADITQENLFPYFAMPENYLGNQLNSYGGYLRYRVLHTARGYPKPGPDVILTGNGYTIFHKSSNQVPANQESEQSVQFFYGQWMKNDGGREILAQREEIMMVLANLDNILIKLQYNDGQLNTTIKNIEMDSAGAPNHGLGSANYVEECACPAGYTGSSCEKCSDGFARSKSGAWLGQCIAIDTRECRPGEFGDPARGLACAPCPCPFGDPSAQFGHTCSLNTDNNVVCDCAPGYEGRRCQYCSAGYTGNPSGREPCRPIQPPPRPDCGEGAIQLDNGQCQCKSFTYGSTCSHCKENTFHLSRHNQFGCITCFCMGVTNQCTSSNLYRDRISSVFTRHHNEFQLVDTLDRNNPIRDLEVSSESHELVYNSIQSSKTYYWSLPSRYLGDKVDAYGGKLNYTLRVTPLPGGQSSRNSAADVEIVSHNNINLLYYSGEQHTPTNQPQSFEVPLLEQYWQRSDGKVADREHLLMALSNLSAIYIKATYYTQTGSVALIDVALDIASERNTGRERALEVEQCRCPVGYRGLSCEHCAVGYTRSDSGIYLNLCEPCECNGNSNECDPETGSCLNCRNNTMGDNCEECLPGYAGDALSGRCLPSNNQECRCDPRGSLSQNCNYGSCPCKSNVEGANCDSCRPGTFGLSYNKTNGCESCYCFGASGECSEANLYIEQIPFIPIENNHDVILVDRNTNERRTTDFDIDMRINRIGYRFPQGDRGTWYWSLPGIFTGNQIKSYGGRIEFTQSFQGGDYSPDQDILISGRGVNIGWSNRLHLVPGRDHKISVSLLPESGWLNLDQNKPASREDILTVLSEVTSILIRASLTRDVQVSYLSDLTLDTAVQAPTSNGRTSSIEACRCPEGYQGTSCESCAPGFYRDTNDLRPFGSCKRCDCNGNENSCSLNPDGRVQCHCKPGYSGYNCLPTGPDVQPTYPDPDPNPPPPQISVTISMPEIEIFEVGSTVRYNCSAFSRQSHRTVRLRWYKQSGELADRAIDDGHGSLTITNLMEADSGSYVCEAYDGYNIAIRPVSLIVGAQSERRPQTAVGTGNIRVNQGQPIQVSCVSTGYPEPEIRVERVDGSPINPYFSLDNGEFRIHEAQKSDEGHYRCIGQNRVGTSTAEFRVYVQDSPGSFVRVNIEPAHYEGERGDLVQLTCRTETNDLQIKWTRDDAPLPYKTREEGSKLIIPDAQPEDSGVYICRVTLPSGSYGQSSSSVRIINSVPAGAQPSASVNPNRYTISQGGSLEVACQVNGNPTPIVKWSRMHAEMGPGVQQIGSTLYLKNARVEDRGTYICVATNNLGLAQAYAIIEVNRLERPQVTIYPNNNLVLSADSSETIRCSVIAGIPSPEISWSRPNNQPLGPRVEVMSGGALRFNQVSIQDEGQYICTAENEAGRTTSVVSVVVETPPRIRVSPGDEIRKVEGESLRLECSAEGIPRPSVQWQRDGPHGESLFRSEVEQFGVAVMEFMPLSRNDEGTYLCIAKNSAGLNQRHVNLIVDSLPSRGDIVGEDPTRGPSLKNIDNNRPYPPPRRKIDETFTAPAGTRASLRCNMNNRDSTNINWIRGDNSTLPPTAFVRDNVLYIDSVQPNAAGEYKCLGIDTRTGQVVFSLSTLLNVISPPKITLNPERQVVRPGQDATIQCLAIGEQPIQISWAAIDQTLPQSVTTRDGYLHFSRIKTTDAGRYRCTARNSAGEADSVAEVLVEETVRHPVITSENKQVETNVGSDTKLTCRTQNSNQRIRWFRDQRPMPSNAVIQGDTLTLHNVQPENEGRYYCEASGDEGTSNDYTDLVVTGPAVVNTPPPTLYISPSTEEYRAGDQIRLSCQSREPGVIVAWTKVDDRLAGNTRADRGVLTIDYARRDNTGLYRCEANGYSGLYYKDQYINVIDDHRDEPVVETKTVVRGTSVVLTCNTNLPGSVNYLWTKQNGNLPSYVEIYNKSIVISNVDSTDAGTYICQAQSGNTQIEVPSRVSVTGLVPYFPQSPLSYIALQTLPDSYVQFTFEISFKPENGQGLILYNSASSNSDFISLALINSIPEFKFNLGYSTTTVKGTKPLANQQWHTIKVIRKRRSVSMYVNGEGPYVGYGEGKVIGLDLSEPLYLGGMPQIDQISQKVGVFSGMIGCIGLFKIGQTHVDILKDAIARNGTTSCETCAENRCENQGMCQENLSKEGYVCLCTPAYSGATCNKPKGEACSPRACGAGRCIDTENSFECLCPLGYSGPRCEREIIVEEPAFSNGAYIAYPPPTSSRRLKITMKIKPRSVEDSVLLYTAETDEGYGEFLSLSIKDKHLEFRFDAGNGVTVIRQREEIEPNKWTVFTASRTTIEGRLVINGGAPVVGRLANNRKVLSLNTPVYIGGYDKTKIKLNEGVMVSEGFTGCISQINMGGAEMSIVSNVNESANIEQCTEDDDFDNNLYSPHHNSIGSNYDYGQAGCNDNPCVNGECIPLSPVAYQCSCRPGFSGRNCDISSASNSCNDSPCKNGGTCRNTTSSYVCDCPLRFTGPDCEQTTELRNDVHFDGSGYLEFSKDLMEQDTGNNEYVIAFELSTNHSNGLIFWHGQRPNEDGEGQDYVSLSVVNGYLEYSYDLGSGPAIIRNGETRIDDGERHSIILKRQGKTGSLEVDNTYTETGESDGIVSTLNAAGNIYLGGTPNIPLMTSNRLGVGFNGCIHGFELQGSRGLDLGVKAINGVNAKPCSRSDNALRNDLVN